MFSLSSDCLGVADLTFLVDSSSSIDAKGRGNFDHVRGFMKELVSASVIGPDRIQVGIVKFSTNANEELYLNRFTTREPILDVIDNIEYKGGETNTAEGLQLVRSNIFQVFNGDRPGAINILIIITDGESNINEDRTIPEANLLKDSDTIIVAVGVTNDVNRYELQRMASSPGLVFFVDDFNLLNDIIQGLIDVTCVLVESTPPPPPVTGESMFLI